MSRSIRMAIATVYSVMLISAPGAQAQELYRRSPNYDLPQFVARLPPYCLAQYFDTSLWRDPRYSIIAACGVGMNHFCPSLLNIMRAEYTVNPKRFNRREELRVAKQEVDYTLARLEDPAACPYSEDIFAAKRRVELLEKIVR